MDATPVARTAEPGSLTLELQTLDAHYVKLLRLSNLKKQLAELTAEHDRLDQELFGERAL